MILRLLFITLMVWLVFPCRAQAQNEIKDDFFSYQVPAGWTVFSLPKIAHPMALHKQDGFSPYIQIDYGPSTQSLVEFAANNKATLKKMFPNAQFVSEQPFTTTSGASGIRIVVRNQMGNNDLQPIYYLFEGSDHTKYAVFANCSVASFDQCEPIFDAAMKTLVIK